MIAAHHILAGLMCVGDQRGGGGTVRPLLKNGTGSSQLPPAPPPRTHTAMHLYGLGHGVHADVGLGDAEDPPPAHVHECPAVAAGVGDDDLSAGYEWGNIMAPPLARGELLQRTPPT